MPRSGVEGAIRSELARRKLSLATDPLAAAAVALARSIDDPGASASGRAAAVKELRTVMSSLASAAAEPVKGDDVDDLAARRAARRSG